MLSKKTNTNAFFDVDLFKFCSVKVVVEHCFKVSVMTFVARPLVVYRIREESVEAKTYQKWFTNLPYWKFTSELE